MLTLKDLLITRFIYLLDDINPTLTTSQREALHPSIRKTIVEFITFIEEYVNYNVQQDSAANIDISFFQEINDYIVNIIDDVVNEDRNLLSIKDIIDPTKFNELRRAFSNVMKNFYVHRLLKKVKNDYYMLGLAKFDVGVFVDKLRATIADNMLPVDKIIITGLYRDILLKALGSISDRVVNCMLFIPYARTHEKIKSNAIAAELPGFRDAVILNALWVIKRIGEDLHKDIYGCNFDSLGKQAKALNKKGFTDFSHVAYFSKQRKKEYVSKDPIVLQNQQKFDSVASDVNDLILLLTVTRSTKCISVPRSKRDIMRAINPSLLLHSLLYLCVTLEEDLPFEIKDFFIAFAHRNLSMQQCLPGVDPRQPLPDANVQIKAAEMAIGYMMQFILRITDHRVTYAASPGFEAECMAACMELLSPPFNGVPRSVHTSPAVLPMFSEVMRGVGVLGTPLQSSQSSEPTRKMQRFA